MKKQKRRQKSFLPRFLGIEWFDEASGLTYDLILHTGNPIMLAAAGEDADDIEAIQKWGQAASAAETAEVLKSMAAWRREDFPTTIIRTRKKG